MNKKNIITILIVLAIAIIIFIVYSLNKPKIEVYTDISNYESRLQKPKTKWHKWNMDESIWPNKIASNMKVLD